jgi:hypothetical protein
MRLGADKHGDRLCINTLHGHWCFHTVANTTLWGGVTESDTFLGQTKSLSWANDGKYYPLAEGLGSVSARCEESFASVPSAKTTPLPLPILPIASLNHRAKTVLPFAMQISKSRFLTLPGSLGFQGKTWRWYVLDKKIPMVIRIIISLCYPLKQRFWQISV